MAFKEEKRPPPRYVLRRFKLSFSMKATILIKLRKLKKMKFKNVFGKQKLQPKQKHESMRYTISKKLLKMEPDGARPVL